MAYLLKNLQTIGAKVETERYTEEATVDYDIAAYDVSVKFTQENEGRPIVNTNFTKYAAVVGAKFVTLSFKVPLAIGESIATAPSWGKLLEGCKMDETLYALTGVDRITSSAICSTLTMKFGYVTECSSQKAMIITMYGAAGKVKIIGKATKPVYLEFEFSGAFSSYEEANVPTLDIEDIMPAVLMDAYLTIGGFSNVTDIDTIEIDLGNVVEMQADIGEKFGYKGAKVVDRALTVKIDPFATGTTNGRHWYTQLDAGTINPMVLSVGDFVIGSPALQLVNAVQFGDRAGNVTDQLEFAGAYAGNDSDADLYIRQGTSV